MTGAAYGVFVEKQTTEKLTKLPPFTQGISLQGFFLEFKAWAANDPTWDYPIGFSDEFTVHGNAIMYVAAFPSSTRSDYDRIILELGMRFAIDGKASDFPLSESGLTPTGKGLAAMWWIESQIEENV